MKRAKNILFYSVFGFTALSGFRLFASPANLAEDLAALVAEGKGVLMPDLAATHVEDRGVMELSGDFPADFLLGLVPVEKYGVTVYPVAIRIDDTTGSAIFYNANETSFYTVPRIAPANWFALLHPLLATNPWFAESRVVTQWTLVPPESLDAYLAASNTPPAPPLRSAPMPAGHEVTNLMFTAISVSESNVVLDIAWPTNDIPDGEPLDLYFSPELATNIWTLLDTAMPTDPTNATFIVDGANLPGFIRTTPSHIHDASCLPITNIIQSVFLEGSTETNVTYSCQTNPPAPPVTGFFRVGTRQDSDGDGLSDAFESMVSQTSRWLTDTDGDGLSDHAEFHVLGTDPLFRDTDGDGLADDFEIAHNLSATSADTDGDGLNDYEETRERFTSATNADTDGDGLSDADEILVHYTSPFDSDTDDDGLPDVQEVSELNSNPLSWDTDSDGIDDYTEYSGRNTGLNLLDASDAGEDWDGDGLTNLQEIQTAYSHIVSASSNAVPRLKLLRIHPLESPKVSSSTTYTRLLALGENAAKGAKIRIPRSTQYGTTNIVRRLHYTDAPGIFLGTHSLAGGGTLEFPDSLGDIELAVHSTPEFGGTVSTLTLEDVNTVDPGTATLAVPKMVGAQLRLSNAPLSANRTNLVNGVLGTICVGHFDPDFGMPRFTLSPSFENDSPTGHRSLGSTDLVLVKVSGATNLTTTANYLRWDSVHPSRRGQELPVGISRIDAGLDFDFDGELDDGEIAVSCNVHVARIALLNDANRDGTFGNADGPLRNRWTTDAGALLAVDNPPSSVAASRAAGAASPLSPIYIFSPLVNLPEGYHLDIKFDTAPTARRIYTSGYTNALDISSAYVVTQGLAQAELANGRTFYVSSSIAANGFNVQPEANLTLRLMRGITPVATNTVVLKIPPLIIPWNTLPLSRLWTCDMGSLGRFPASVAADRQICLPDSLHGGWQWSQDIIQTYAFQKDTVHGWQTAFADTGHGHGGTFPQAVAAASAADSPTCLFYVSNSGNGGNVEATPPLPGYPYGRLLTGTNMSGHVCKAIEVAEAQGLQGPAIKLPVGWLAGGHVDEVCCFIGERTVMVPSPRLAFNLIAQEVVAHNGNYTNTFIWGTDINDYIRPMQDILFDKVVTNANWATDLTASATTVVAPIQDYSYNDVIYCDGEIIGIAIFANNLDGTATLYLDRGLYGTTPQQHSRSAMLLWLSEVAKENYREKDHNNVRQPCFYLNNAVYSLQTEMPEVSFMPIPVLYTKVYGKFVAGSANMVNAVVDGNSIYMTDPGCDLFRNAVNVAGKVFVGGHDVWTLYHCSCGELHCGSEAEREIPASPPWWQRPEFANWPYEKKGVSP